MVLIVLDNFFVIVLDKIVVNVVNVVNEVDYIICVLKLLDFFKLWFGLVMNVVFESWMWWKFRGW